MAHNSKYSQERVDIIIDCLELGMNYRETCQAAGISYETFRTWYQDPAKHEFKEYVDLAKSDGLKAAFETIRAAQKKGDWRAAAKLIDLRRKEASEPAEEVPTSVEDEESALALDARIESMTTREKADAYRLLKESRTH